MITPYSLSSFKGSYVTELFFFSAIFSAASAAASAAEGAGNDREE
jgi:hypothetical protein